MSATKAQRLILVYVNAWPEALRFGSHYTPKWWIESGPRVSSQSCDALLIRGLISNARHLGGEPGVNCFCITDAGRAALEPSP